MKNYKKTVITVDDLEVDDHIKVAGVLYRIDIIQVIGDMHTISFRNVHRPSIQGIVTLESNTLMHIWNQK